MGATVLLLKPIEKVNAITSVEKAFYKKLERLDHTLQLTNDGFRKENELLIGDKLEINLQL